MKRVRFAPSAARRQLLIGAAAAIAAPRVAAQGKLELRLSHYLPPTHLIATDWIGGFARALEAETKQEVTVRIFASNSPLGNPANQHDQVKGGVVDIAFGLHGIPRGRFPRTGIVDMPFLTQSAQQGSRMLWDVYPTHLAEEYAGLKVLGLIVHNPGVFHTANRRVATLGDLRGLRMRAPSPVVQSMLEHLGATVVGMPPGQIYESLRGNVIDGFVLPWDPIASFKLAEVTRHHLDAGVYTVSFWLAMNEKRYQSLPAEVRAAIDKVSGAALVAQVGAIWDKADQAGREAARARGNEIVVASAEQRAAWLKELQPVIDKELERLQKEGIRNARDIYEAMRKTAARYAAGAPALA